MRCKVILLFCFAFVLQAQAPWTKENTALEFGYNAVLFLDWKQTREFTQEKYKDIYYEANPLLGKYPSRTKVNIACVGSSVGHYIVSRYLIKDEKWRRRWQYITLGLESGVVGNNFRIGICAKF